MIYTNAQYVGDFGDDWEVSDGTKVAAVQPSSGEYIYLDAYSPDIQLRLLRTDTTPTQLASSNITLTTTPTVYTISLGVAWNMTDFNKLQGAVAGGEDYIAPQSFKFFRQPAGVEPDPYVTASVGCEVTAWYEDLGGGVYRLKVSPFRRFHTV